MLLELWALCDGGEWRHAHLVRCFAYPTTVGTAMMVQGNEWLQPLLILVLLYYEYYYDCKLIDVKCAETTT